MDNIKRIVFPIRRCAVGTAAMNRLLAYAKGFAELGIDVWFYFIITDNKKEKAVFDNPRIHQEYLWENNGPFLRKHRVLGLIKNLITFRKKIKRDDILFLNGTESYICITALSVSRFTRIFCEETEHPFYNGKGFLKKLKFKSSLYFLKKIDGLFVISESLRDFYIANGVKQDKVCVINMFVDSTRFSNLVKQCDKKYIAYCGYVSRKKDGADLLIQSFALFHKKHPKYALYIIGRAGFPEPLSYFENLAKKYGVEESVVFTGEVSSDRMPQLLVNAEILALARPDSLQARNGFPTKLGEYLSTGNPIVVTSVGEIPLFIKDKVNGVLAIESNVEDFAKKMSWVAEHPDEANAIGKNGKKLVENEFSYLEQSKKALSFINKNILS